MDIKKHSVWFSILSTVLFVFFLLILSWFGFSRTPVVLQEEGMQYNVPSGYSIKAVTNDLYRLGVLKHPKLFNFFVVIQRKQHQLKAGEYFFPYGTTINSLLQQITSGKGVIYHAFMIVPGWDFQKLKLELAENNNLQHSIATMTDGQVMQAMGASNVFPEGQFFPDTYYFVKGASDLTILKRAYQMMQNQLTTLWATREAGLPYQTPYQALIAASLIEKEAKIALDRPLISGVIVNRLKKGMPLQLDPTVIYAAGAEYDGVISKKELTANNPYNTYVKRGLPPSPIAMPSKDSLVAALHPTVHTYLYFVAKEDGLGGHEFTETLAEHHVAVAKARGKKSVQVFFNEKLVEKYFGLVMSYKK